MREMMPRLPEGPCAARSCRSRSSLCSLSATATRVGRFLQNRLLAEGGWFPSLRPPSGDRELVIHAHATADLDPMIASLAAGSHEAADRDREWSATSNPR
jgi:hypothetical protein